MGLDEGQEGVLVQQVIQGSPADEAALSGSFKSMTINGEQVLIGGDVIVALDGEPVSQMERLAALIAKAQPGQKVELAILRDGKQMTVTCTLAERPSAQ
ncbi:MAG: PDZ domain-containing protein, partial [Anaerolineales bacterium]|nr:PDZ domain-containing protein [Anaerolineales bacterium]